jgi:hypothetical protein
LRAQSTFSSGVAEGWRAWSASGDGYWKRSSRLGRLGSGSYADAARRVARFEKAFSDRLHELGRKSVVLNLSVGNPGDIDFMLLPEVVSLLATADYAGYHAYSSPDDQRLVGPQSPWYAHRWRIYAEMYRDHHRVDRGPRPVGAPGDRHLVRELPAPRAGRARGVHLDRRLGRRVASGVS